jgi:hypothetical protein
MKVFSVNEMVDKMRIRTVLTNSMLCAVMVSACVNLCWGQSYWKREYKGLPSSGMYGSYIYGIAPTLDGNFLLALTLINGTVGLSKSNPMARLFGKKPLKKQLRFKLIR